MSQDSKLYTTRSLILTAVVAIIGSVLVLEITGKIDHSDNKENLPIGEFTAIQVTPGEPFNMSSKASELHARCENGYLAIAADIDSSYRGVLVDYKKSWRALFASLTDRTVSPAGARKPGAAGPER